MPTWPKICAGTTLGNLKLQIELSTQYLHGNFNESLNSYKHGWQLLSQKLSTYSKLHLYITCSKCPPPARTEISDVEELRWRIKKLVKGLSYAVHWTCASVYMLAFVLEADISSIWCKDDVTYYMFDDFLDNKCQPFCSYSPIH